MREFAFIFVAGLASAILGGSFGAFIGWLSPEFIDALTHPHPIADSVRFGIATGLVSGLLIGSAAMAFGLLVAAFRAWAMRPVAGGVERPASTAAEVVNAGVVESKIQHIRR